MCKRVVSLAFGLVWLGMTAFAHAQRTTEMFIPIGESPGVSRTRSVIGQVEAFNQKTGMLSVSSPSGALSVRVVDRTRIWRDRSPQKLSNETGSTADLQPGKRVEVKFEPGTERKIAQWVKVQTPLSSASAESQTKQ